MLLSVKNLNVELSKEKQLVRGISFEIGKGEIFGLVGESGSGKSMTSLALLQLLPKEVVSYAEQLFFDEKDLSELTKKEWQELRGNDISMIFQEPMTSLNPVLTIGTQVEECLLLHDKEGIYKDKEICKQKVIEALGEAGLRDTEELLKKYPHQLSGGMRQRVMIAMAMLCKPKLLIADEPTTALDAATEKIVLELLSYYRKTYGTSILFISHDLSLVASLCDRVAVMKSGRIVELGTTKEIFLSPKEEYTKQLILASKGVTLAETKVKQQEPLLRLENAVIQYEETSIFGKKSTTEAVNDVSFTLCRGEILGLVGESGSGKSSLSKAITGLLPLTKGTLWRADDTKHPRMVFQDPYGSLNPAKKIGWILEEPLKIQGGFTKKERKRLVIEALKEVELDEVHAGRYVRELSGGQRQRVAIAVALIQKPDIIVLDEPVSALDVTVQGQILKLLYRLKEEHQMSYLFVSHDMEVIRQICDRVMILYQGELVEEGKTEDVFEYPKHPYTKKLVERKKAINCVHIDAKKEAMLKIKNMCEQ